MSLRTDLELTDDQEHVLTRLLQVVLVGLFAYGLVRGSASVAVNAAGALLVSALPALLRREVGLRLDFGLVLWLTVAVLLHAIGILGPYRNVWWYDHVTHALSASVVAGVGYAVARSIDVHSDSVSLPEPFFSAFLFLVVVAFAVVWEVVEFAVTTVSEMLGMNSVLVVFGPADIVTDIVFTALGGLLIVLWGRGYFRPLAAKLTPYLPGRAAD